MSAEKRLYELVNPSDPITFQATPVEAAIIADRMLSAMYFVKDAETGESPSDDNLKAEYDALWKDADRIASYAEAYRSFLIGSISERQLFEDVIAGKSAEEAEAYRKSYHGRRRSSMNDICKACWTVADKIAATSPEA